MRNNFGKDWKLESGEEGKQIWKLTNATNYELDFEKMRQSFLFSKTPNPNASDKVYRASQNIASDTCAGLNDDKAEACYKAVKYYLSLQSPSGFFPGDYGGPHFLTPGLVIASYVTQSPLPKPHQALLTQYILNHQNEDGGWGLHIEDSSTMFGTVMNYVALRLMGSPTDNKAIAKARSWIKSNGGATKIPSWGKFYLSVLGVYSWDGCHSLFPEMWLLPQFLPFHPSRYWCHTRMVYLPMAYCYGLKVTGDITPLIIELRDELYRTDYKDINWIAARSECAVADLYHQPSRILSVLNFITNTYERIRIPSLRKRAIDYILTYIQAEDEQTNYIDIGPVNQVINSICIYHALGKNSQAFQKHYERWFDYLWLAEDGMKMNGYNGSQLWDTAFASQAISEGLDNDVLLQQDSTVIQGLMKAFQFVNRSQIKEEVPHHEKFFRHPSVGGWPFSTVEHGWPITDCTAEGLKTALLLNAYAANEEERISAERLRQACQLILSLQNPDGGWASYELTRAPKWVEKLNPSEIFGNIMIDYSYTECTSACVQSLIDFEKYDKTYESENVKKAIERGIQFILSKQLEDGSWYGSWAVCFTYGTWFGTEALYAYRSFTKDGKVKDRIDLALLKTKTFLLSKQNNDGGWGESFASCRTRTYEPHANSQVVNTSWALLALMRLTSAEDKNIDRGIALIKSRQLESGDFPQEGISGVFNHSCGITYTSYRNVFPIWALARYQRLGRIIKPQKVDALQI